MNLINKNKLNQTNNRLLSATRPRENILSDKTEKSMFRTKLKQKKVIKIYVEENKYYIEHSAAYALGLIKTRSIMLDKPKKIELSSSMHNKLKNQDDIDIEYVKLEKKPTLIVYVDNSNYYIDNATAYALGWITIEQFYSLGDGYYYISNNVLGILKQQYDIVFYSLNLHDEIGKNK